MRNLNYLKKLIAETIEEDVRKSSRKKSRISESRRRRAHKRKLQEGLRKAKLILEAEGDEDAPAEVAAKSSDIDGMSTETDINRVDPTALAAAAFGGAGAEKLLQSMKDVKSWAAGALKDAGVTDVASMKAAAEKIWPSQDELVKRITDLSKDIDSAQGFEKPEMPAFEDKDFEAIQDALNDGGTLAVDHSEGYKDGVENVETYHAQKTGEMSAADNQPKDLDDADKKIEESISRWSKLAGLNLLTEINDDKRFPFSGPENVMPGSKNRGDNKESTYDHSSTTGLAKTFLEKGQGTGDEIKMEKNQPKANSELKPTQTNVKAAKSLLFAFCNSGLDFEGAYATKEGHILDGHHRWSGQYLRTAGAAQHVNLHIIHKPSTMDIKTFLTMLTSVGQALGRPTKKK